MNPLVRTVAFASLRSVATELRLVGGAVERVGSVKDDRRAGSGHWPPDPSFVPGATHTVAADVRNSRRSFRLYRRLADPSRNCRSV